MTDDARDLNAAQAGDPDAFARLYDRHAVVVCSLCRHCAVPDVDEAVQETFVRAFRLIGQVDGPASLRAWLYGIARHVCRERRRSNHRRNHHEEKAHMIRLAAQTPSRDLSEAAVQREELNRLTAALDDLPDDERLAIHLFYLESDAATAASAALGLSRSGFYKLLSRARERLAASMGATGAAIRAADARGLKRRSEVI